LLTTPDHHVQTTGFDSVTQLFRTPRINHDRNFREMPLTLEKHPLNIFKSAQAIYLKPFWMH
jgi:hypothetical protein